MHELKNTVAPADTEDSIKEESAIVPDTVAAAPKTIPKWKKAFRIVGNIVFALILTVVAVMAFFLLRSKLSGTPPTVAGQYVFIVLSGSMEPEFATGSIVFVKPTEPEEIQAGDIITFTGFAGSDRLTTHRVVDINEDAQGETYFITKGDANNATDPDPIPAKNMVGTVSGSLPLLGYFMHFVQTRQGMMALVIIPGAILIGLEAYGILKRMGEKKEQNAQTENSEKK